MSPSSFSASRFDPAGMVVLYDNTLGAAGTFDVSNLPGGYRHLRCDLSARGDNASAQENVLVRFNNDSGSSNYIGEVATFTSTTGQSAGGSTASSMHVAYIPAASATAGKNSGIVLEIPDYAGTTFNKKITAISSNDLGSFYLILGAGTWLSTAAVNRIAVFPATGSFAIGSRLTIYGVGGTPRLNTGFGTALPSTPVDGDEFTLVDSTTAPTYQWRFRYVAAKSSDKWVFIGGPGAYDIVGTPESTSSSSPVNLSTTGPDFTIPVDGDYTLEFGCHHDTTTSGGGGQMGLSINGAAPGVSINLNTSTTAGRAVGSHCVQMDDLNVSDTVVAKYQQLDGVGSARFYARWLRVTPRAVGG